eukprot:1752416-Prymnesium_polylepis.1
MRPASAPSDCAASQTSTLSRSRGLASCISTACAWLRLTRRGSGGGRANGATCSARPVAASRSMCTRTRLGAVRLHWKQIGRTRSRSRCSLESAWYARW